MPIHIVQDLLGKNNKTSGVPEKEHEMHKTHFILLIQFILLTGSNAATGCEIDPFLTNAPLLIHSGTTRLVYPLYGEKTVIFKVGGTVEFSCPQRIVLLDGTEHGSIVHATCTANHKFKVGAREYPWEKVICSRNPVSVSRYTNKTCGSNAKQAEIGFHLDSTRFLQSMSICFNKKTHSVLWSHSEISSTIAINSNNVPRPAFQQDTGFYDFTVNTYYTKKQQRLTLNSILGLPDNSTKYVQDGQIYYLARGHLAARSDFIYAAERNATFKYINAAPQWQSFNGYNWAAAERSTRTYADSHKKNLQVWTGTYGVATLPHKVTGHQVELYLYEKDGAKSLPVPALFWKLVYDPSNKRGIVLIGLNNPYDENVVKICTDVSSKVTWLTWDRTNILRGYSYACDVASFRKVVAHAPSLTISGLLV